jgi:translation initiation factor IF-3
LVKKQQININEGIRARELRVISEDEGNLGVMSSRDALKKAQEMGLDLIEISPDAKPPVAKITDYGKYQYDLKKKQKEIKANTSTGGEVKSVQIKIGTSDNDVSLKAKRASKWLQEGNRVKVELFLRGRSKYTEKDFQKDRLQRILDFISEPYKIVDDLKKSPKGIYVLIERDKKAKKKESSSPSQDTADNQ